MSLQSDNNKRIILYFHVLYDGDVAIYDPCHIESVVSDFGILKYSI